MHITASTTQTEGTEAPALWTPRQVADYLGVTRGHLANQRSRGVSPIPFSRIGTRIRYRASDVHAYIESRTQVQA